MSWADKAKANNTSETEKQKEKDTETLKIVPRKRRIPDTRVRTNLICIDSFTDFDTWDEQYFHHLCDLWEMLKFIAKDHHLNLETSDDDMFQEFRHFIYTKSSKYVTFSRNERQRNF